MGDISKQRQLNEKKWYGAVPDLDFFEADKTYQVLSYIIVGW
jgi:hypothetical protein